MDHEYMYNMDGDELELRYNNDGSCTVYINGRRIKKYGDPDRAYKSARRNGYEF